MARMMAAGNSYLAWVVRHNLGAGQGKTFNKMETKLNLEGDDPTRWSAEITVDATSIDTNNENRDRELHGEHLLEVNRFPHVTFKTLRVEPKNGDYRGVGELSMLGITGELEVEGRGADGPARAAAAPRLRAAGDGSPRTED